MDKNKIEIRTFSETPIADAKARTISGYAVVWDVESRRLWDGEEFVEIIARGAITEETIARCDVKALYNHNSNQLLARSVNGVGTLTLKPDERGLFFSFDAPDTNCGNDVLTLVRLGDLRGCSFAFEVDAEAVTYSRRADGTRLRTINRIAELHDVSVVVNPAYLQTSVSARSWEPESKQVSPIAAHEERKNFINNI